MNILGGIDELRRKLNDTRRTVKNHKERHQRLMVTFQDMKATSTGYLEIRQRFLDVFQKDAFNHRSRESEKNIMIGNTRAHASDCVTNAEFDEQDLRNDSDLMIKLYGMSSKSILELRKSQTN